MADMTNIERLTDEMLAFGAVVGGEVDRWTSWAADTIRELARDVQAAADEIERLRIWSSDSHVTELEAEIERLRGGNGDNGAPSEATIRARLEKRAQRANTQKSC